MVSKTTLIVGGVALVVSIAALALFSKRAGAVTGKGHLIINTIPAGASVSVNGSSIGTSPVTVDVDPGTYAISISLAGYNNASTSVTIEAGSTHTLNVSLTPVGTQWTPINIVWS